MTARTERFEDTYAAGWRAGYHAGYDKGEADGEQHGRIMARLENIHETLVRIEGHAAAWPQDTSGADNRRAEDADLRAALTSHQDAFAATVRASAEEAQ